MERNQKNIYIYISNATVGKLHEASEAVRPACVNRGLLSGLGHR